MTKTATTRARFTGDHAWLRRARRLYAHIVRPWVEEEQDPKGFRARLWFCAERAVERGLYAPTTGPRDAMFGLLSKWRAEDRMAWWPWMHADERRASVADWTTKIAWIREDARRLRA